RSQRRSSIQSAPERLRFGAPDLPGDGPGRHDHGVVTPIMRVSDPKYDGRMSGSRVFVRFRLNRQPDQSWIETFKRHAASSVLRAAHAVVSGTEAMLELAKPKSLAELSTALWTASSSARTSGCAAGVARREAQTRLAAGYEPECRSLGGPSGTSVSQG